MRVLCSSVLILLTVSGTVHAQVPPDWEQWVADGLVAEDNAEYKDAEKLFGQACDVSLAQALGSERLTRACSSLTRIHATQNNLGKASTAAENLVAALEVLDASRPVDRVQALIEAASMRAAGAYFPEAEEHLKAAIRLSENLEPAQRAMAYADVASFFRPADLQAAGGDFLRAASANLSGHPQWEQAEFVTAAAAVGNALQWYDRRREAIELLTPALDAARRRAGVVTDFDDLWGAYSAAAGAVVSTLESRGDRGAAEELREEIAAWPPAPPAALRVGDEVSSPRLQRRVDPSYTLGASRKEIVGVVVLAVEVWPDGRAHNIRVLRPLPYGLSWVAVGSIRKWRFQPGMKGDEPVKVTAQIEVNFRGRN